MFRFWSERETKKVEKESKEELMKQNKRLFEATINQLSADELIDIIERGNAACESLAKLANGCVK